MKVLAVLAFLLGAMALLQGPYNLATEDVGHRAIAVNYAIYRNEVFRLVYLQPEISGDIALASLKLPQGWKPLREWRARVANGRCYVFGQASPGEIAAVRKLFLGSFAIGQASSGLLIPASAHGAIPVPGFIPDGSLVSITEVRG